MEFKKSLDNLNQIVKVILAILPVVNLIWVAYAIIRDQKNITLLLLDIILGIVPLPVVFYIANIICLAVKDEVFSFGLVVEGDPIGGEKKEDDNTIEVDSVEK